MLKDNLKKGLYNLIKKIKLMVHTALFKVISVFTKVNKNKVVFRSFNGISYSCNPRAISEELYEQYPNMKIIWLFNNIDEKRNIIPTYIHKVKNQSIKSLYHQCTANYWVDNFQNNKNTFKRKDQIYIQTWHGDRAFKKILYDSPNNFDNNRYVENKICNIMTVGSIFGESLLTSAFDYSGEFLKYGSPRNDLLVNKNEELIKKIKHSLGISCSTDVLLFAPTYRRYNSKKTQKISEINLPQIIKKLENKYNNEWICLTRSHSNSDKLLFQEGKNDQVIDVSNYEDMADLLLISDMLITDYSSSAMDFVINEKPIILFQPDREEYMKFDRTFYIPIEDTPFFVSESQNQLLDLIENIDEEIAKKNCEKIMEFYGFYETGEASKEVVRYISSKF